MKKINLLSISFDSNIAQPRIADARDRQIAYSKYFNHYTVLILSTKSQKLPFSQIGQLRVIPTNSTIKPFAIIDALRISLQQNKLTPFDLITADDPLFTGLTAVIIKLILKIPLNIQFHIDYFLEPSWIKERWQNQLLVPLIKFNLNLATSVRVVNQSAKNRLHRALPKLKAISFVAPVPADINYFWRPAKKKPSITKLISVGRLIKQKNHPILIRAFKQLITKYPQLTLTIVGEGSQRQTLTKLISDLNLTNKVKLVGSKRKPQVRNLLHRSDLFVLASNHEGWGLVYLEAMAAGLPVITTSVSSLGQLLIPSQTALVSKPGDAINLARNIEKAINSPKLAFNLVTTSQSFIKAKFTSDKLTQLWINGLAQTVNHTQPA